MDQTEEAARQVLNRRRQQHVKELAENINRHRESDSLTIGEYLKEHDESFRAGIDAAYDAITVRDSLRSLNEMEVPHWVRPTRGHVVVN